jgi:CspA family cold shock protein
MLEQGTVKWFNTEKGFGFITRDNGNDIFVHHSEILLDGFRNLQPDQRVEFTTGQGPKGPCAQRVQPL